MGAVDVHDEIPPRLALGLGRWPLPDAIQPVGHGQDLKLALFQPAQVGRWMKYRAELVGAAFVKTVEIVLDHGFDGRAVMTHRLVLQFRHSGARVSANPESRDYRTRFRVRGLRARPRMTAYSTSKTRPCRRPAGLTVCSPPPPGRWSGASIDATSVKSHLQRY